LFVALSDRFPFTLEDYAVLAFLLGRMLICCRIGLNLRFEAISQELFPLPTLSSKLKDLAKVLTNGVGFFLIRGLDPKQYSSEINLIMYLGISSYIGDKRGVQDERGNMLRKSIAIEQFPCFGLSACSQNVFQS
jgi:hypothetical protein